MKILGYADRLSVAPGEAVRFMVSCSGAERYRAEIVRIVHGDANPAGPGLRLEPVESAVDGEYPGRVQAIHTGSFVRVPDHARLRGLESFTVLAMIWPTTPARGRQGLIAQWSAGDGAGFALALEDGEVTLTLGDGRGGLATVASGRRLLARRWYLVAASFAEVAGLVTLVPRPLAPAAQTADEATVSETVGVVPRMPAAPLLMAGLPAAGGTVGQHYNGKLDSPALFGRVLDPDDIRKEPSVEYTR
jgi:N,N-dimethylformamidase